LRFYCSLAFISPCSCVYFFVLFLASLCSLFPFWARAVVFSMASTPWSSCGALPDLVAPHLVSRRCSASPGSAPMRVWCVDSVPSGVCIPVLTSTASPRSRHRGTLRLPFVNLAPRLAGGMIGGRNERQTHLPSPPVWTAPLRSSRLSSPSRGIVARRVISSYETPESSFQKLSIYI